MIVKECPPHVHIMIITSPQIYPVGTEAVYHPRPLRVGLGPNPVRSRRRLSDPISALDNSRAGRIAEQRARPDSAITRNGRDYYQERFHNSLPALSGAAHQLRYTIYASADGSIAPSSPIISSEAPPTTADTLAIHRHGDRTVGAIDAIWDRLREFH